MENLTPETPILQCNVLLMPVAVFGKQRITFAPENGPAIDVAIPLTAKIQLLCARWSHEPNIVAGVPVLAGADVDAIQQHAVKKLQAEYARLGKDWPGTPQLEIEV
jgi:hypothetical protein